MDLYKETIRRNPGCGGTEEVRTRPPCAMAQVGADHPCTMVELSLVCMKQGRGFIGFRGLEVQGSRV